MQTPSNTAISNFQKQLVTWHLKNGRNFPWRKQRVSNYQKVIAEVLLQRTKAETVAKFYPQFIKRFPSWKALANTELEDIENSLKAIGLQQQRAARLLSLAKEMTKRNGRFPKPRHELEAIPFVGQYIASSIMLLVHGDNQPLLDVNMARVLERFFGPRKLADIRYDRYLQNLAGRIVKCNNPKIINWAILDFAAMVCKARRPECHLCSLKTNCSYFNHLTL
jgi:A/G-specific adenine glycosylase